MGDNIIDINDWETTPCVLRWNNLNKTINVPIDNGFFKRKSYRTRTLISNLNGEITPGRMLAVMGPTGSGKTTLLNILSGRLNADDSKSITYNGNPINDEIQSRIAYVLQDDIFYHDLTVRQILTYTARLRSKENVTERVNTMINELGLKQCENTIIGNYMMRGVSGGERKRTNIANELLGYPSIILLDEPTSGLDSAMATKVMTLVKGLTKHGMSVIVSIHQPSSHIYSLFDELLLMCGGKTVYYGPINDVPEYLSQLGYNCPMGYSISDYLLDLLIDREIGENLTENWENKNINTNDVTSGVVFNKGKNPSWLRKTLVLLERCMVRQKSRLVDKLAIIQMVIVAIIAGLVWLQSEHKSDIYGALFFIITQAGAYNPLLTTLYIFPPQYPIIKRERSSKLYSLSNFVISQMLTDIPLGIIYPFLFITITYWMIGLNPTALSFFALVLTVFMGNFAFSGYGYLVSALVNDLSLSSIIATSTTVVWMICSGFFVKINNIPGYIRWIQWISPIKYQFETLIENEFENGHSKYYFNILILFGFGLAFRIMAYFAVRRRVG